MMEIVNQEVLQYIEWYEATYPEYDQWTCTAIKTWILNVHNITQENLSVHAEQFNRVRTLWSQKLNEHRLNKGFPEYYGIHPFLDMSKKYFGIELLTEPGDEDKVYARINLERKEFIDWVKKELTTCLS
ncbi:hypothetical protein [Vibrio phage PH669]|uniref:Uncharacterized protein n=1 Tax=Vibrio phage PH669 TaxID=2800823 RepID=A0A7T6ZMM1_9CAUD|nr:hypothetical protein [Vibrio phage PH669]